jgi:mediator of RNA polymerase II transcription subunit 14
VPVGGSGQAGTNRPSRPVAPDTRQPLVGGTLHVSLEEDHRVQDQAHQLLTDVRSDDAVPAERLLRLKLGVKWEVGELGEGGGWKFGDALDSTHLEAVSRLYFDSATQFCQYN